MSQEQKFAFVQQLAIDLNRGDVNLPSFPDVVIKTRQELEDPECDGDRLAGIISKEPALASRLLVFANSAHYNPAGANIVSLTAAIGRIGFIKLRSVAITYAVEQLHYSKELHGMRNLLEAVWGDSLRAAAMAEAVATQVSGVDTESAYMAGLLSRIGTLYIMTQRERFPELIDDADERTALIAEWNSPIAESIVTSWGFPAEIATAINPPEEEGASHQPATVCDVLSVGEAALLVDPPEFQDSVPLARLGLSEQRRDKALEKFESKMASFAAAA